MTLFLPIDSPCDRAKPLSVFLCERVKKRRLCLNRAKALRSLQPKRLDK